MDLIGNILNNEFMIILLNDNMDYISTIKINMCNDIFEDALS